VRERWHPASELFCSRRVVTCLIVANAASAMPTATAAVPT
jgi:hypothetical protein